MRPTALAIDLLRRGAEAAENRFGERKRDLAFAGKNSVGAGVSQCRQIAQVRSGREDSYVRVQLARDPDDLGAVLHACRGENQGGGVGDTGAFERLSLRRVAVYRGVAALSYLTDAFDVQLDDRRIDFVHDQQ